MDKKDSLALISTLNRIAAALEEANKLSLRGLTLEKKRYNKDYDILTESGDSKSSDNGKKESKQKQRFQRSKQ